MVLPSDLLEAPLQSLPITYPTMPVDSVMIGGTEFEEFVEFVSISSSISISILPEHHPARSGRITRNPNESDEGEEEDLEEDDSANAPDPSGPPPADELAMLEAASAAIDDEQRKRLEARRKKREGADKSSGET